MNKQSKEFLYKLLTTPSVSGYEVPIQRVVKDYITPHADTVEVDLHGNLVAGLNVKASKKVMLAGHCDQIGFMVRYISKDGCLHVAPIGGIDFGVVPGSKATVHTKNGPVNAVFGRRPIHLQDKDDRAVMKLSEKYFWLDVGAKDQEEAEKMIGIGDPVTYHLNVTELANNLIAGPGMDDRVGCYVAIETLKECSKRKLAVALYAASTVQEEVGLRGAITAAYSVNPEVGLAIDVTHATDNPGANDLKDTTIAINGGPTISRGLNTNPVVEQRLLAAAKDAKVKTQVDLYPMPSGTDASAIQLSRGGTATASIGIPCRYMHTNVEVVSLQDIDNTVKLLTEFICKIQAKTDFRPL